VNNQHKIIANNVVRPKDRIPSGKRNYVP